MDELDRAAPISGEWECMECGYIERGVETRRPKKCPECGAPASALEFFSYDDDWDDDEDEDREEDEEEEENEDYEDDEVEEY